MKHVDCAGRWKYNCMYAYEAVRGKPRDWKVINGKAYCAECAKRETQEAKKR